MRRIGEAFYGRQETYRQALVAADEQPLAAALRRNVFADGSDGVGADRLATYVREVVRGLAAQSGFERAQLAFPDPEQVPLRA
jgi:hypothetical protein